MATADERRGGGPSASDADETSLALRHLVVVASVLSFALLLVYVVPSLGELRPWTSETGAPLETLVTPAEEMYAFAGVGNTDEAPADRDEIERDLGAAVAANLGASEDEAEPEPTEDIGPRVHIRPSELEGLEVRIEDPTGRGMRPFYAQLERTALAEQDATTIVSHWGDSSIATDLITFTARRRLQRRFGDAGHGFVLAGKGYLAYRHRDVEHRSNEEWMIREITRNHDSSGFYGLGGVQFRGRPGAWSRFATAEEDAPVGTEVSRFRIFYQRHRRGGHIHYRVDGGSRQVIDTRQDTKGDAVETIDLPLGPHRLEVRFGGHGQPRVYGVVLEREGPGVQYDSIGLVGARAARLLYYDPAHVARQLEMRGTHLVVLGFGGNEAGDNIDEARYRDEYREVIQRMRGNREDLGCLVFSPLDQGERDRRGDVQTMPNIPTIVSAQRQAAFEEGCAFFDTWTAMGGEGAVARWLRSRPRLASSDLRHMTPAGYEVVGNLYYKALLAGFAEYLESQTGE